MKALLTLLATITLSLNALATGDAMTVVYLVTHDYNMDSYDVVGYQYSGCYGIPEGPQTAAFAEPFVIAAPRGCGGPADLKEDMNALSCASAKYTWDEGYTYVRKVDLDISKCEVSPERLTEFKIMAQKAAKKNFQSAQVTIK